jgi:hypothetical protein
LHFFLLYGVIIKVWKVTFADILVFDLDNLWWLLQMHWSVDKRGVLRRCRRISERPERCASYKRALFILDFFIFFPRRRLFLAGAWNGRDCLRWRLHHMQQTCFYRAIMLIMAERVVGLYHLVVNVAFTQFILTALQNFSIIT